MSCKNFTVGYSTYDEKGRYSLDWFEMETDNPKKVLEHLSTLEDINFRGVVKDFITALKTNSACDVPFHEGLIKINKPACPTKFHQAVADLLLEQWAG